MCVSRWLCNVWTNRGSNPSGSRASLRRQGGETCRHEAGARQSSEMGVDSTSAALPSGAWLDRCSGAHRLTHGR